MRTVIFASFKGGVAKSTLSINAAVAAEAIGLSTVVLDADPNATCALWARQRQQRGLSRPVVEQLDPLAVEGRLKMLARQRVGLAIVDMEGRESTHLATILRRADLALIPGRPTMADLGAAHTTVAAAMRVGASYAYLFSFVRPGSERAADEVADQLIDAGLPVCPIRMSERASYVRSYALGLGVLEHEPDGPAAREMAQLIDWITRETA